MDGWHMTGPAGSYYVIGYGGELRIPTLDFVAGEKNIVGNIVGTYTDLAELMVLAQAGKVTLHTQQYPLDRAVDALRRSEEHTSELQSRQYLVCRLLLEKKKT